MPVTGTPGDDDIQLPGEVFDTVDLGDGTDTVRLAPGVNYVFVSNTENVIGGSGNDTVVENAPGLSFFNGGDGFDQIQLGNFSQPITLQSVERVYGDAEASDITYQFPPVPTDGFPSFYLGEGYDRITFDNGPGNEQRATLADVEEVRVVRGTVDLMLLTRADIFELHSDTGAAGVLTLDYVASGGGVSNQVISEGRNTIIGTAGNEVVDVLDGGPTTVFGRGGEDTVRVFAAESRLELTDIATVRGSKGSDSAVTPAASL